MRIIVASAAILLATVTAVAEQPDQVSREMIKGQLRSQLSVPGSLTIMHVEVTRPNDKGLQTACGWFVSRDTAGKLESPKAFAMSYFISAQLAQIHSIAETESQIQTVRVFCKELGIDF